MRKLYGVYLDGQLQWGYLNEAYMPYLFRLKKEAQKFMKKDWPDLKFKYVKVELHDG